MVQSPGRGGRANRTGTDEFMPPLIFAHADEQEFDGDTVFFSTFEPTVRDNFRKRSGKISTV
jgi:hypothetical protein